METEWVTQFTCGGATVAVNRELSDKHFKMDGCWKFD